MVTQTIFFFPGNNTSTLADVGGKGLSLIQGSNESFPVPSGFILSVAFFSLWFQALKKTEAWNEFIQSNKYELKKSCEKLKKEAITATFTKEQEQELSDALKNYSKNTLFAVRSSSPEEDLEGASFAGGYESILGVNKKTIKNAIRKAFASCLDFRIVVYKKENGFNIAEPKIAVIIQEQIASEVAGVGFSLNPVTNNYDEAVITANFGLGETVVQGIATPDTFNINKVTMHITNTQLGSKETSIWLLPNGGTEEKKGKRNNEFTLTREQILELTSLIKKVEALYRKPMDIEWAFAKEKLYLLQARPITAYIPLSWDTQTQPGEKKRLYFDVTTTAQGIDQPISILGVSSFRRLLKIVGGIVFAKDLTKDIHTSIAWVAENGRLYANVSNLFTLFGKKKVVQTLPIIDPIAAKALLPLAEDEYTSTAYRFMLLPIGLILRMPKILFFILQAKHDPKKIHEETQTELLKFEKTARMIAGKGMPLVALWDELLDQMFHIVFLRTVPLTFASRRVLTEMKKMVGESLQKEVDHLELSLPHNVTTEMGLCLCDAASHLPEDITFDTLQNRLQKNDLPSEFMSLWGEFLKKYGLRGPSEIDIAAPRYRENPDFLLDLMVTMRYTPVSENTRAKFKQNEDKRQKAYKTIYHSLLSKSPKTAQKFASSYRFFEMFGGYRETHKYYLVFVVDLMRQKILDLAQMFQEQGRLEEIEQIFYVTLEDLDNANDNIKFNLIEKAEKNKMDRKRFEPIHYPALIDSRGFIPHPIPVQHKKGEIIGTPISAGIARGKIKVLHTPSEKPFEKGEILVAKATDPGWTPLFANAAAVVLEIGGILQHGALVAREYGVPCVTGVENATTRWKDGTIVEVDGSKGTITIIK